MEDSTRNVRMFSYYTGAIFESIIFNWFHQETFIEACENGRIDEARQLLRSGANANATNSVSIIMEQLMIVFLIV